MKGFNIGILIALYALPAVATGGVSRIIPGTDTTTTPTVNPELRATTASDTNTARTQNTARTATTRATNTDTTQTRTATTRNTTRATSADNVGGFTGAVISRTANRSADMTRIANSSDTSRANLTNLMNSGRNTRTEAASINANPAVRRAGLTLRPSTAEVGGRAIMADGRQTGSNIDSEIRNLSSSRIATINFVFLNRY